MDKVHIVWYRISHQRGKDTLKTFVYSNKAEAIKFYNSIRRRYYPVEYGYGERKIIR